MRRSGMKVNTVKEALKRGEPVVGTMVMECRTPEMGRLLAAAGFDFMIIDTEHSPHTTETVIDMIRAARGCGLTSLVRVPDALYTLIARTLDIGAEGVMVPRVERVETVREVVASVKYPPLGRRGWGVRAIHTDRAPVGVKETIAHLNENSLVIIQIESEEAIDRIEELVGVAGVDVALVGPADLSISLGVAGEFGHPKMVEAMGRVVAACEKAGAAAGAHLMEVEQVKEWMDRGMRCLICSTDERLLLERASEVCAELKAHVAGGRRQAPAQR
jgi:2-keto-3-deoxy-L-rhamnonate aldolase RhmA